MEKRVAADEDGSMLADLDELHTSILSLCTDESDQNGVTPKECIGEKSRKSLQFAFSPIKGDPNSKVMFDHDSSLNMQCDTNFQLFSPMISSNIHPQKSSNISKLTLTFNESCQAQSTPKISKFPSTIFPSEAKSHEGSTPEKGGGDMPYNDLLSEVTVLCGGNFGINCPEPFKSCNTSHISNVKAEHQVSKINLQSIISSSFIERENDLISESCASDTIDKGPGRFTGLSTSTRRTVIVEEEEEDFELSEDILGLDEYINTDNDSDEDIDEKTLLFSDNEGKTTESNISGHDETCIPMDKANYETGVNETCIQVAGTSDGGLSLDEEKASDKEVDNVGVSSSVESDDEMAKMDTSVKLDTQKNIEGDSAVIQKEKVRKPSENDVCDEFELDLMQNYDEIDLFLEKEGFKIIDDTGANENIKLAASKSSNKNSEKVYDAKSIISLQAITDPEPSKLITTSQSSSKQLINGKILTASDSNSGIKKSKCNTTGNATQIKSPKKIQEMKNKDKENGISSSVKICPKPKENKVKSLDNNRLFDVKMSPFGNKMVSSQRSPLRDKMMDSNMKTLPCEKMLESSKKNLQNERILDNKSSQNENALASDRKSPPSDKTSELNKKSPSNSKTLESKKSPFDDKTKEPKMSPQSGNNKDSDKKNSTFNENFGYLPNKNRSSNDKPPTVSVAPVQQNIQEGTGKAAISGVTSGSHTKQSDVGIKRGEKFLDYRAQKEYVKNENELMKKVMKKWKSKGIQNPDTNLTFATRYRNRHNGITGGRLEGVKLCTLWQDDNKFMNSPQRKRRRTDKRSLDDNLNNLKLQLSNINRENRQEIEKILRWGRHEREKLEMVHRNRTKNLRLQQEMECCRLRQQRIYNPVYMQYQMLQLRLEHQNQFAHIQRVLNSEMQSLDDHYKNKISKEDQKFNRKREQLQSLIAQLEKDDFLEKDDQYGPHVTTNFVKGPCRDNNNTRSLVSVCLPSDIATSIMREDEVYDNFYRY